MPLFKKKLTLEQFVDSLLLIRMRVEEEVIQSFEEDFEYQGEAQKLKYEARLFALWLITLCTPPKTEIKDQLHHAFYEYLGIDDSTKEFLSEELDKRYKNYYAAFEMWQKNPGSGHMIGSVMLEIIKNQNSDFSLKDHLPLVGAFEALQATTLFGSLFKASLDSIGNLKKEYKVNHLWE